MAMHENEITCICINSSGVWAVSVVVVLIAGAAKQIDCDFIQHVVLALDNQAHLLMKALNLNFTSMQMCVTRNR